jgi:hypothetical protein
MSSEHVYFERRAAPRFCLNLPVMSQVVRPRMSRIHRELERRGEPCFIQSSLWR